MPLDKVLFIRNLVGFRGFHFRFEPSGAGDADVVADDAEPLKDMESSGTNSSPSMRLRFWLPSMFDKGT